MPRYQNPNNHVIWISMSNPNVSLQVFPSSWAPRQVPANGKKYVELDEVLARPLLASGMLSLAEAAGTTTFSSVISSAPAIVRDPEVKTTFTSALPADSDRPMFDEQPLATSNKAPAVDAAAQSLFTAEEIAAATTRRIEAAETKKQLDEALQAQKALEDARKAAIPATKPKRRFVLKK